MSKYKWKEKRRLQFIPAIQKLECPLIIPLSNLNVNSCLNIWLNGMLIHQQQPNWSDIALTETLFTGDLLVVGDNQITITQEARAYRLYIFMNILYLYPIQ